MRLVVATHNSGKLRELRQMLADLPVELLSAEDASLPDVEETGTTFEENALLKARAARDLTGCASLGEDSGIEVDALGGEPGVYSARFAGPGASDDDRNRLLIQRLDGVSDEARTCRYRSVLALAMPDGSDVTCEGRCEGQIGYEYRGENGFGYDPIFVLPDRGQTMAELSPDEKNAISHRGRALASLQSELRRRLSISESA